MENLETKAGKIKEKVVKKYRTEWIITIIATQLHLVFGIGVLFYGVKLAYGGGKKLSEDKYDEIFQVLDKEYSGPVITQTHQGLN